MYIKKSLFLLDEHKRHLEIERFLSRVFWSKGGIKVYSCALCQLLSFCSTEQYVSSLDVYNMHLKTKKSFLGYHYYKLYKDIHTWIEEDLNWFLVYIINIAAYAYFCDFSVVFGDFSNIYAVLCFSACCTSMQRMWSATSRKLFSTCKWTLDNRHMWLHRGLRFLYVTKISLVYVVLFHLS